MLPKILVNVIFFPHAVGRFRMPCDIFLTLFYLSFHNKKEEPRTWRERLRLYLAYRCCIQRSWVWQCTWFQQFHGSWFKVPCRHHISQHLKSKYIKSRNQNSQKFWFDTCSIKNHDRLLWMIWLQITRDLYMKSVFTICRKFMRSLDSWGNLQDILVNASCWY